MWHKKHHDCPPEQKRTPPQNRKVSLTHLTTVIDSVAFYTETVTSHDDRFFMQRCLTSAVYCAKGLKLRLVISSRAAPSSFSARIDFLKLFISNQNYIDSIN
jgi:hypothetical protein